MTADALRAAPVPRVAATTTLALTGHALRAFGRRPMSAFFTLAFPLSFFLVVNALVGDQPTELGGSVRISQYLVAPFAVFGAVEAVFCVLAIDLAALRENGVLKRLRGTPVPASSVLAARVAAAVVVAGAAVLLLLAVGVAAFDVELVWRKVPAAVLAVLAGVACFAALGLALVGLTRSVVATQALSNGLVIPLAFVSNVFMVGVDLPAPLAWLGRILPLRHFADALSTTFDPVRPGTGFRWGDLAMLAAWGLAGALVARWRFGWEPRRGERRAVVAPVRPGAARVRLTPARRLARPPGPARLVGTQVRAALIAMRRDALSVFFAVIFPVLLLVLFPAVFPDARFEGMALGEFMVPAMIAYSVAVIAFVNTPTGVAEARENGTLDRLRGSPAPLWTFYAGRVATSLLVAALAAVLLVGTGLLGTGYRLPAERLPAAVLGFALGVACFSVLGFALAAAVRASQAVTAVALGTLLPLSFISDIFIVGDGGPLPPALRLTADVFPLRHLSRALLEAMGPAGSGAGVAWGHLAVLGAWTAAGAVAAALLRPGRRR